MTSKDDDHDFEKGGTEQEKESPGFEEKKQQEGDNNKEEENDGNNNEAVAYATGRVVASATGRVVTCVNDDDDDDDNQDESCTHKSHFKDQSIPIYVRLGIFIFLLATSLLLLAADIGSGVTVDSILTEDGEVVETNAILNVSVISSVGKLWNTKSYPLAIFIAITSIGWPYVKLAIATYAWMMPYRNSRRRELLIEVIDVLGKWSFVDIMVLVEIMVAFRSTVDLGFGLKLEIVLVAQWGFYGFVSRLVAVVVTM
jgi:hypothetical protein